MRALAVRLNVVPSLKIDADRGVAAGLDHVALEHGIADVERDGDAVAHRDRVARDRGDAADRLRRRSWAASACAYWPGANGW